MVQLETNDGDTAGWIYAVAIFGEANESGGYSSDTITSCFGHLYSSWARQQSQSLSSSSKFACLTTRRVCYT